MCWRGAVVGNSKTLASVVALILGLASPLWAQGTTYSIGQVLTVSTEAPPTPCMDGNLYIRTAVQKGLYWCEDNEWTAMAKTGEGSGSLPSGFIGMVASGTCPAGTTEVSALNDKFLRGTIDASGDVGDVGGSDSITPTGTNSTLTFTGSPFSDVINHTHPITDPGHVHIENNNSATTGGLAGWAARDTSTNTAVATGYSTASATTGVTTENPVGGVSSITPAGTINTPTFTGDSQENRPAFVNVIFCAAN